MEVKKVKIAVTSQNRKTITEHAGQCRKFRIFEIDNKVITGQSLIELPKEQSFHNTSSHDAHPLDEVDVLIAGSMGQGLVRRLAAKNIQGIVTTEQDPQQAVENYLQGSLEQIDISACSHSGCNCHH